MADKKTQAELEQPAKVYQLNAVESNLDAKLNEALNALKTITTQTAGLATTAQLEESKKTLKVYVDNEIKKLQLEYKPLKTRTNAITIAITSAVVLQLIYILFNLFGVK